MLPGIRAGGCREPLAANTAIKHRRHDRLLFFKYICSLLSCLLAVSLFFSFCYDSPCGCCVCPFLIVLLSSFFFHVGVAFMCHSAKVPPGRGLGWEWVHDPIPRPRPPAVWTHCRGSANTYRLRAAGVARLCIPARPTHACPMRSMAIFLCFPRAAERGERTCADPVCTDDQ